MNRPTLRNLLTLVCVFLLAAPARGSEPTRVVLRVTVNTVDQGDQILELTDTGDIVITAEQLGRLGLQLAEARDSSQTRVSLRSLAPRVRFELDESTASLHLTVPPELLPRQELDLAGTRRPHPLPVRENVAFLNYQVSHRVSGDPGIGAWSLPLESGIRVGGWLGLSTFSAASGPQGREFSRLNSSIILDDSKRIRRIVLGDLTGRSERLDASRSLGGIQIASNFALDRTIVITPHRDIEGALETPSDVEIYLNGVLVRRDRLPPGTFHYSSLPLPTGSGHVSLIVRDAFGRERVVAVPFYESPELLKPGLADYSWSLGFDRRRLGLRSWDYGPMMLVGTHRVGISETTTIGLSVESDRSTQVVSPSVVWAVHPLGAIRAVLATSRDRGTSGVGGALTLLTNGRRLSADLTTEAYSRPYVTFSTRRGGDHPRLGLNLGAGVGARSVGSFSLRLTHSEAYRRPPLEKVSFSWTRGIGHDLSLVTGFDASRDPHRVIGGFALLNLQLGSLRSAGINLFRDERSERAIMTLQQGTPIGTGVGYQLQTSAFGEARAARMASTTLQREHGQYSIHASTAAGVSNWDVNAAGSLALVGHALFLSRPISDGFALVRVGSIPSVPVLLQNRKSGSTNHHGSLLIPDLVSNSENSITLDPRTIPIDWGLTEIERSVSIPFRGGGVVDFAPKRVQSFEGRILLVRDGVSRPAEYAGLEIEIRGSIVRSIVGMDGLFYLENLPEGSWPARIFLDGEEGHVTLRIPKSSRRTVALGEIRCEVGP